jgi:hypothetical protein
MPGLEDERPQEGGSDEGRPSRVALGRGYAGRPEEGPWRRTSQHDAEGEGPGSWGPDGRHPLDPGWRAQDPDPWDNLPVDDPWRPFPGGGKQSRSFIERNWLGLRHSTGRGHQRTDARIREDVNERFARSNVDAQDVDVKVEDGEVTLSGTVENRWDKRMLEELTTEVPGVEEVQNDLLTKSLSERAADGFRAAEEGESP